MNSQLKLPEPNSKTCTAFGRRSLPGILLLGVLLLGVMLVTTVALIANAHAKTADPPQLNIQLASPR
ncbi:MAG TPA: hypothetical protein VIE67_06235 [Rudaea sp.]|uniref:hypothetical protein n=1 Tax=Rudaea sp. TaxID=2136325 RepID=UPI002F91EB99